MPAIDPITANPDENNPATLASEIDLFISQLKAVIPQFNAAIAAFNIASVSGRSYTSMSLAVESKSFTLETGKSFLPGMTLRIARTLNPAAQWMEGEVFSYNSATGAIVVDVRRMRGSGGPYTDWTISFAAAALDVGDHEIRFRGGDGYGAVRTKRRKFATAVRAVGTAITYTHTNDDGLECEVTEDGFYTIIYRDSNESTAVNVFGITVNNTEYTTSVTTVNVAQLRSYAYTSAAQNPVQQSVTLWLNAGDKVAPHTEGNASPTTHERKVYWSIVKVGN